MKSKIFPPTYFMISFFLIILLHYFVPIKRLIFYPYNLLGIPFLVFGIIMNLWTDNLFKIYKTTVKPDEMPSFLIKTGPFKITRHPMYLGMASILLGTSIFLGSIITLILPFTFIILMQILFTDKEEKNLEIIFKKEYIDYKKKVRLYKLQ